MNPLLKKSRERTDEKYLLRKYCFISAVLAMAIMVVIYIFHDNSLLFGKSTVLRMDLYHQYGPLYAEVLDRLLGGNSFVYSWTSGLGASFIGNFFNYCSSPFVLFMLICGHKNMPEAIALMIMFKAVLASVTFTYYVNKSNNSVKKESIAFGLLYAFCGYFVAYSWNIMWFDAVAVFPLVILGIERIIQYNKPLLYITALTYTMITNYYMAFMVCILSVMYFLYYYFGRYELSAKIHKTDCVDTELLTIGTTESADVILSTNENSSLPKSDISVVEGSSNNSVCVVMDTEDTVKLSEHNESELIYTEEISTETNEPIAENSNIAIKKHHKFKDNRFWVTGWSFASASILCFLLAAFALIPVYFCLQSSSATNDTFPKDAHQYFDIFTFIANHLPGIEATIRSSGDNVIPNVYCGLITVMLLPFYFFSDKIPGRQKIVSAILLISCLVGFSINYFNYIWHGLHMPNDLPYRWSFAYSFFLLLIAYKAFENIKEFSKKSYIGIGFAIMCLAVLVEKFEIPNSDQLTILLTCVFAILYVVIFGMLKSEKYKKNSIIFLLFFTIILEIVAADAPKIVMQQGKEAYTSDYTYYQQLSESVEENDKELFYRTELAKLRARMDPSWYGYNGVSIFSSMAYDHTAKTMEKLGLFGNNINSYTYYPQTAVFNSMFSIRYLYDNMNFIQNDDTYTLVDSNEKFEAFKYNYYLPLITSVSSNVKDWNYNDINPFNVQNNLMSSATGVEDVLIPVKATSFSGENIQNVDVSIINSGTSFNVTKTNNGSDGKAIVKIVPEDEGNYYVYIGSRKLSSLKVTAKDLSYNYASTSIEPFILDLGYLSPDDEIVVTYTIGSSNNTASLSFCAAKLDNDKFKEAYNIIKANGTIEMSDFDETSFSGKINVTNNDSFLWTSIPYDESWEITLDGKVLTYTVIDDETNEVTKDGEIVKVGGGLIGIETEPGEHEISFKYKAKGLTAGIKLTVAGLLVAALIVLYKLYLKKYFNFVPVMFRELDYQN